MAERLIYELEADEVYHLAAQTHVQVSFELPEYATDLTGLGTPRILEAIRRSRVKSRFYQASSSEMFGTAPPPQDETPSFALAVLILVNLYGPRDNFDLDTSFVISSLIRKCVEAKWNDQSKITAWGTGQVTREFIYVEDAAEAIVMAAGKYQMPEPVSLGSGQEISLYVLAYLIKELVCY